MTGCIKLILPAVCLLFSLHVSQAVLPEGVLNDIKNGILDQAKKLGPKKVDTPKCGSQPQKPGSNGAPWHVGIWNKNLCPTCTTSITCQGTLISSRHVLTHSSCLDTRSPRHGYFDVDPQDVEVWVGMQDLDSIQDVNRYPVSCYAAMFALEDNMFPNEIVVIALRDKVDFSRVPAIPACLPEQEMDFGGSTLTSGFFLRKQQKSIAKMLVKTQTESLRGWVIEPEHQFCSTEVDGTDVCDELGAPLISECNGVSSVVGIFYETNKNCASGAQSIFIKLKPSFIQWIKDQGIETEEAKCMG